MHAGMQTIFHEEEEIAITFNNSICTLPHMGKQFNITFDVYLYEFGYNPTCSIISFRTCTWKNYLIPAVWTRRTKKGLPNRKGDKIRFMVRHDGNHGNGLTTGKWWLERLKWKEVGNSVPLRTWKFFEISQTLDGDGKVCIQFYYKTNKQTLL